MGMTTKKVLVTGAGGFIGSHLVRALLAQGAKVVGLVRPGSDCWRLKEMVDRIELIRVELGIGSLKALSIGPIDAIYHLAAGGLNPAAENASAVCQTNIIGTIDLLNFAVQKKAGRFIYCGSCFEYAAGKNISEEQLPAPATEYAASKSAGWLLAHSFAKCYRFPVVTLRPFTVYGPYESSFRLVPYTIVRLLRGLDLDLTAGKQARDFIYIEDVVDAFLRAGECEIADETFNISTGSATTVETMAVTIARLMGVQPKINAGVLPYRESEIWEQSGNPQKAKEKLGWTPRHSLEEGLTKSIGWFRENHSRFPEYCKK